MKKENLKKMKRTVPLLLVVCVLGILWLICIDKVEFPDDIEKITITFNSHPFSAFSYTDKEKINNVDVYFSSLNPRFALINPGNTDFAAGSWLIDIDTSTGTVEIQIYGNFIKMPNGKWRKISNVKSNEFDNVLKENIPDEMPENDQYYRWLEFDEWFSE